MNLLGFYGWNLVWSVIWATAFVAFVFALFAVVRDLFDDHELKGWWKAIWVVFLVLLPVLTVLVYLVARGSGMQARARTRAEGTARAVQDYLEHAARRPSPADEITRAKALLDDGTISAEEFATIKAAALAPGAA